VYKAHTSIYGYGFIVPPLVFEYNVAGWHSAQNKCLYIAAPDVAVALILLFPFNEYNPFLLF